MPNGDLRTLLVHSLGTATFNTTKMRCILAGRCLISFPGGSVDNCAEREASEPQVVLVGTIVTDILAYLVP